MGRSYQLPVLSLLWLLPEGRLDGRQGASLNHPLTTIDFHHKPFSRYLI